MNWAVNWLACLKYHALEMDFLLFCSLKNLQMLTLIYTFIYSSIRAGLHVAQIVPQISKTVFLLQKIMVLFSWPNASNYMVHDMVKTIRYVYSILYCTKAFHFTGLKIKYNNVYFYVNFSRKLISYSITSVKFACFNSMYSLPLTLKTYFI